MKDIVAVLDACVLYPAPIRDLFMHLAVVDAFRAKWSVRIHEEWMRNVLKNRADLTIEQLERTKRLMDQHVRDSLVFDYEEVIESLELPDANDRHVLAAAIVADANYIVTFNLKDFPLEKTQRYGVTAIHPDTFVLSLIAKDKEIVLRAVKQQHESLRNPPITLKQLVETLQANNLPLSSTQLGIFLEVG